MNLPSLQTVAGVIGGRVLRGDPGIHLTAVSTDTRTLQPGALYFALVGDVHDAHAFLPEAAQRGAAAAVVHNADAASSVPSLPLVLVQDTTRALGDLAHWYRKQCPTTVIGITGSNGKTTTKEMLYHILDGVAPSTRSSGNQNNQIGVPLTLFKIQPGDVYAVVEMGTNSPGEIARLCEIADPDIGLLTNISAAHLDGLKSVEGVAREKSALLRHTVRRGGALYNADDYWSRRIARTLQGNLVSFGIQNKADIRTFHVSPEGNGVRFRIVGGPTIDLPVPGEHNARNALAAIAVARKLGIDWDRIAERIASFRLPNMRMEVRQVCGVTLINDAYNANPVSMEAAVRTLRNMPCSGRRILVVGDMHELGPSSLELHRGLGKVIAGYGLDYLLGIGPQTAELLRAAAKHGMSESGLHLAESKEDLAAALLDIASEGDIVLFKASRAARLEDVVASVERELGAVSGGGTAAAETRPMEASESHSKEAATRAHNPGVSQERALVGPTVG